jgi:hypothetical protein
MKLAFATILVGLTMSSAALADNSHAPGPQLPTRTINPVKAQAAVATAMWNGYRLSAKNLTITLKPAGRTQDNFTALGPMAEGNRIWVGGTVTQGPGQKKAVVTELHQVDRLHQLQ